MYGLVVKALADVARAQAGAEAWRAICARQGSDDHFIVTRDYDDQLVDRLVHEVSVELGTSPQAVLHDLGRHWIRYTAREGWGPLLHALGPDLVGALRRLDELHVRVGLVLPHLRPPSFFVSEVGDDGLLLHYRSERRGLEPMVCGLVEELAMMFETPVVVAQHRRVDDGQAVFSVRFVPAQEGLARAGSVLP